MQFRVLIATLFRWFFPHGSTNVWATKTLILPVFDLISTSSQPDRQVVAQIPDDFTGLLIGKQGSMIKNLQARFELQGGGCLNGKALKAACTCGGFFGMNVFQHGMVDYRMC